MIAPLVEQLGAHQDDGPDRIGREDADLAGLVDVFSNRFGQHQLHLTRCYKAGSRWRDYKNAVDMHFGKTGGKPPVRFGAPI